MMLPHLRKLFGFEFQQAQRDRLRQCFKPKMERLEDRLAPAAWNPIGPAPIINSQFSLQPVTGRITGLAADPTDANIIYIAAAGGGVWKTTNGGSTWTPLTDNQSTLFMGSIAVAPGSDINHRIIYAGTGEANFSGDSFYGRGVLVSKDSGNTWTLTGNSVFNRSAIGKVVIDPTDATGNTAYAAVSGTPVNGVNFGFTGNYGIWKTTNGGITWTNTTDIARLGGVVDPTLFHPFTDLVMDPGNHNILYAAVGRVDGGPDNGVYVTINGGVSWTRLTSFPFGTGRISLAIADVGMTTTLYASVSDPNPFNFGATLEIEKSTNAGVSWNPVMTQFSSNYINYMGEQGWYDQTLIVDPHDPTGNTVYAAGQASDNPFIYPLDSVIKSSNGGMTWTDISVGTDGKEPHVDHHGIGFDASGRLLDGNDGGIWRLDNPNVGSIHWTDLNGNLQITEFTGIALHPTNPNIAFGGSQDNGTEKYTGSLAWNQVFGGDGGVVRVDPNNPQHVYTENFGISFARSDDGGNTFTYKSSGIQGTAPKEFRKDSPLQPNFYLPYVLDPQNSNRVVLGTTFVNQSLNNGDSWTAIGIPGANGFNPEFAGITAIATSGNTVYAATTNGDVWVTTNDGSSWTRTDPIPIFSPPFYFPPFYGYEDIEVDPSDATGRTAYVVTANFSEEIDGTSSSHNHVFKTTNAGANWTDISGNVPNLPTWSIAIDHANNTLYVGNDNGVYSSTNGGASWSPFGTGMPNVEVKSLQFNANLHLLAAGTYGRGTFEISTAQSSSTTTVASAPNPSVSGQAVTLTATVSSSGSSPTGMVTFTSGTLSLGMATLSPAGSGTSTATITTSILPTGSPTITASYGGDSTHSGSSGTTTQMVNKAGTSTVVVTSGSPSVSGQPVTFTATVSVNTPGSTMAASLTGSVTFLDGTTPLGAAVPLSAAGTASISTSTLTVGNHTITASYSGDGNFLSSSGMVTQVVSPSVMSSTTTVVSAPSTSVSGQAVTLTATVTGSGPSPTGKVTFTSGTLSLGMATLSPAGSGTSTAIITTSILPTGSPTITASYGGDSTYSGSSGTTTQMVNKAGTSTVVVTSGSPSASGQPVTFTATVSVNTPGSTMAASLTGSVTFLDGTTPLGAPVMLSAAGTASFTTSSLTVGTHTITASYSGDGNFLSSSGMVTQVVSPSVLSSTTTVVSAPSTSVSGQAVNLTATVTGSGPSPTGTVTFTSGTLTLGTAMLSPTVTGASTASITTSILPTGSDTITASYGGSSTYSGSSGMTTQTVNKAGTSTVVVTSGSPSLSGQPVTFTATVSVNTPGSTMAASLTGSVTFLDGTTPLGAPVMLSAAGTASFTTSSLTVGTHTITASYSGDGNFLSSSGMVTQVVSPSVLSSTTTVVSAPSTSVSGQAVTLTATVTGSGPSPTGTVTFTSGTSTLGMAMLSPTVTGTSTATLTTSILPTGSDTITASYGGSSTYSGSSGTTTQTVNKAGTSTTVVSAPNPSLFGQTVTFTATVSVIPPGSTAAATPTGTVTFTEGSTTLGTASLSAGGTATFSTSSLAVGNHTITASYGGDGNFLGSSGTVTQTVNNATPGNVTATLNLLTGVLSITGDTGNNAITIQQNSPSMLQVAGVSGTLVNQSSNPATFFLGEVTEIDVTLLNGNDSVTMSNFNITGNVSLIAGSGADTIALDAVAANIITISAAGPGADTISLNKLSLAASVTVTTGDNANLSLGSVRSNGSVKLTAGKNATVSVNGLQTAADLDITLGDNAQSVTVKGTSSNNWNISQTGTTGTPSFDLENDTINNNLKLNGGDGNNKLVLSHLNVANQLLIVLGHGKNTVTADHVTAFFGTIDGGPGGSNIYNDLGGNSGFKVIDFVGH